PRDEDAGDNRERPLAGEAGEQAPQASTRRALQALAAEANAVEQQRHPAEQRQQHRHGAGLPSAGPSADVAWAPVPISRRWRCAGRRSPERWLVSFSVTTRGGATTVSEALSTRSRHSELNEHPSK